MKYWLIMFVFNPQGQFLEKFEASYATELRCEQEANRFYYQSKQVQTICVSDNHYMGIMQDAHTPLDFDLEGM